MLQAATNTQAIMSSGVCVCVCVDVLSTNTLWSVYLRYYSAYNNVLFIYFLDLIVGLYKLA